MKYAQIKQKKSGFLIRTGFLLSDIGKLYTIIQKSILLYAEKCSKTFVNS